MVRELSSLSGIGKKMLEDFEKLGVRSVTQLSRCDARDLYDRMCEITAQRQDPCVFDTYRCAIEQARRGNPCSAAAAAAGAKHAGCDGQCGNADHSSHDSLTPWLVGTYLAEHGSGVNGCPVGTCSRLVRLHTSNGMAALCRVARVPLLEGARCFCNSGRHGRVRQGRNSE